MIDKNDPRLTDFVLGELNPAQSAEILDAIADSEELQNAVEEIRQTAMLLDAAYQTEEPLSLLDEQKAEITQIQIDDAARELKPATGGRPWLPIVLAASLLGLLVGGAIYLQDPPIDPAVAKRLEKFGDLDRSEIEAVRDEAEKNVELKKLATDSVEKKESGEALSFGYKPAAGALLSEAEKTEKLGKLVNDFNRSVDEQKYDEAQKLAEQAGEIAPGSQIAEILREKEQLLRRVERMESVRDSKEEGFWSGMANAEQASKPANESISPEQFKVEPFSGIAAQTLDLPARLNQNAGPVIGGSTIIGRDPTDRSGEGNDFLEPSSDLDLKFNQDSFRSDNPVSGGFAVDERGAGQESAQMMKMMQQRAGGGREDGAGGFGFGGKFAGGGGMGMGMGAGGPDAGAGGLGGGRGRGEVMEEGNGQPDDSVDTFTFDGSTTAELSNFGAMLDLIQNTIEPDSFPEPDQPSNRSLKLEIAQSQEIDRMTLKGDDEDVEQVKGIVEEMREDARVSNKRLLTLEEQLLSERKRSLSKEPLSSQPLAPTGLTDAKDVAKEQSEAEVQSGDSLGKNLSDGQKSGDSEGNGDASRRMAQARGGKGFRSDPAKQPPESASAPIDKRASGKAAGSEFAEDEFSLPGEAKIFTVPLITKVETLPLAEFEPTLTAPLSLDKDSATDEESKLSEKREKLAELKELGLRFETRMQPQQETRTVPVQRTRPEVRTRRIELEDGSTKTENYTVEVPYTENVIQNYTVEVPQVFLDIEPATTSRLVENLTKRINPSGTREIMLEELFEKTRELKESLGSDEEEANKDLRLAIKLREQLREQFSELRDQFSTDDGRKSEFDATPALQKINEELKKRNAKIRQARTWKRVKAIPNTTRLMVGDKDELDLTGMQVNVQVDGFRARVLLDYFYYNDRGGAPLRGNFKLRLPDDASLYYFAFGESAYNLNPKGALAAEEFLDDGTQFISLGADKIRDARQDAWKNVKESRMVPREKAAHAFGETVRRKVDPALVEWSGAGVFNAQVFPLASHKLHRIVIGYDVNLTRVDGNWAYELDLPEQTGQCQVDINVQPVDGVEYAIEPKSDPIENVIGGKTQRRYRFEGPQKQTIRLTANKPPEMLLYSAEEFWGVQVTPELPVEKVAGNPRAIFMVDTSLSSNPDKFNVWLKLLESTLENNRDSLKQFNVVFFNVDAHFWQEKWVDNTQENTQQLMEKCNTLALEGATDLYGAIERIAKSDWVFDSSKDAVGKPMAGPDLFLLSDGAANWGETNLRLISRQLQDHQLGSLFAYQTGLTGTAISGLRFLAGQSGGAVFSVANEDEIKLASTAHRKRPWKLASITAAGTSDIMTAGRVQWVYPGQAITIVGRGKIDGDLKLELTQSGQTKSVAVSPERVESELASRLYGQVAVGQLESLGAEVFDVAASYARHFRVTGETCSLLMLESEAEYNRFDIKPHEDLFVIKTKEAKDLVADVLEKSAGELADPKAQLLAWLTRLETMPGMSFKMPTALKLAMDDIQVVAISKPLDCSLTSTEELSKEYLAAIGNEQLDYEVISTEANRRGGTSVDDAIKVFSSLVERNPGDLVIARDVAFTALEMGRPAQAYHLLRSVAKARPFEGSIYPALGQCLTQLGQSDMAIVYYEIALNGSFNRMGEDFQKIVSAEYMYLLRQIVDGKLESSVKEFAKARLETLKKNLQFESADLLITMMWNTDQTDVDLHVFEPSGEECSYENKKTRSGGQITSDITTGYGPEMYSNPQAPNGKYDIKVKYFASNQNRTEMRNKVHLTIYRGFGTPTERVTRKTVQLKTVGEKESVATVGVD